MGTGNASFSYINNWLALNGNNITTNGGNVAFNNHITNTGGSVVTTNGGAVSITYGIGMNGTGDFTINTAGGNILTAGIGVDGAANSVLGKTVILNAGAGALTVSSAVDGAYNLTANAGSYNFTGAWGGTTALGNVSLTTANTSFTLPTLTSTGNVTLNAGTGTITTNTIATGAGNLTLTADDLAIGGNLSGTGVLTLQPSSTNRTIKLNYGSSDGTNFNLSSTELGYFVDGWNGINIGNSTNLGASDYGAATWLDPITLGNFGAKTLRGNQTGTGNASINFIYNGFDLNGYNVTTAGQAVTMGNHLAPSSGSVNTNGGAFTLYAGWLNMGSGGGFTVNTSGGAISLPNITNSGAPAGTNITLNAGSGNIAFTGTANTASNLTANAGSYAFAGDWGGTTPLGTVSLTSTNSLTLPTITASSIFARTTGATSDITLASGKVLTASGAGNALTLAAGRNFINSAGAGAFSLTNAGAKRWLVYSTDPTNTTGEETLGATFNRYSCAFSSVGACAANATLGTTVTIPGTGNGLLYSYTPTLTATPTTQNIVYGAAVPSLTGYGYGLSGYNSGEGTDSITGTLTGSTGYSLGSDVGNYTLNYASGALSSALGYAISYANNAAGITVTPRTLTVGLTGTVNKVYDGSTSATLAAGNYSLSNFYGSDGGTVSVSTTTGTYNDKTANTGKNVSVTGLALTGAKSGNYQLSATSLSSAIGTITQKALALIGLSGSNKVYDTTTAATLAGTASLSGVVGGDTVGIGATGSGNFADKNVGTGKAITVAGFTVSGTDANNYALIQPTGLTANITKAALAVAATGINKVYDTLTSGTVTLSDNHLGSDSLSLSYGGALFADKNVGTGKTLSVSGINVTGTDSGNYSFNTAASTTANITKAALNVAATGINKVYDTLTSGTVTLSDNHLGSDSLSLSYGGALFADKNVGTGKTLSVSGINVTGTDSGNYSFNTAASTTANITKAALNVAATGINKVYDTLTSGTVTLSDNHLGTDSLTLAYGGALFSDKNVGTGKTLSVSGINVTGTDSGNYTFNTAAATTANITKAALAVNATGINKVYDTLTSGTVSLSDNHLGSDSLTLGYGAASFADKNAANGKTLSVGGINVTGTDAGNYTFNTAAATTANITKAALAVAATGINKVYDALTSGTVTLSDNRLGSDSVTLAYGAASFADKNVGTGKALSVTGINVTGTDSGNYSFNTTASTTANITKAALAVAATGINKVYDTLTSGTVTLSDNHLGSDSVTLAYGAASFADKNVGTGKALSVTGINVTGTDSGNYSFNTTASTTANITKAALAVAATGINKVYDTLTSGTVTLSDNHLGSDSLNLSYGGASFADKNAANGKTLSVAGINVTGTDSGNYTFNTTASTTANITKAALNVAAAGINKVYDTLTSGTVTLSDNHLGSDILSLSYGGASFADKNVGTGKTLSVTGINVTGTDAGNYTFNTTASTTANITNAALAVNATGINKVYDTLTSGTVTLSDNRLGSDSLTLGYGAASFADKNAANGKTLSVGGINVTGTDAGNYTFNTTASTTADITRKALTVAANGINKVYDTLTSGTVTLSDNHLGSDSLNLAYGSASYADKNAANGKVLSVSGINVTGTDSGNYSFNTTASTMADITKAALNVAAAGINKVYDTLTSGTVTLSDNHLGSDSVTLAYGGATYADKNVGTGKALSVTGIHVTGTDAGNYTFNTTASTTADITKAALIASAGNQSVIYGTTVPTTGISYSGFLGGETAGVLATAPVVSSAQSGLVDAVSYLGNYTVGGGVDGNYSFSYVAGDLTVAKKALTITADNQSVTYGTAPTVGTLSYSGFITGQNASFLTAAPTVSSNLSGTQNVGTYVGNYTPGGAASNNYSFSYLPGNLVVTKKNLNISADNYSVNYGTAVPMGSVTYNGFITGENASFLLSGPVVALGQSGIVNAGSYAGNYTASGATSNNYSFTYSSGTLTVNTVGINVTAGNRAITYGDAVPTSSLTYTGFVNGEDETILTQLATLSSAQSGLINAGTYTGNYTATGAAGANYTFTYINGDLSVAKKDLNVTAGNRSMTYGDAVPGSSLAYSGFITGQDGSFLGVAPVITSIVGSNANAGSYAGNYVAAGGVSSNYQLHYTNGDLTVTKAQLIAAANSQTLTYGNSVPAGTVSYTGFVNGENSSVIDTQAGVASARNGIQNAGTYLNNYTASGALDNNYSFTYASGNLNITKAGLLVSAASQSIPAGSAVPAGTFTYSGFVNGENSDVLDIAPVLTSARQGMVLGGRYAGNYGFNAGMDNNYDFSYLAGDLTVGISELPSSVMVFSQKPIEVKLDLPNTSFTTTPTIQFAIAKDTSTMTSSDASDSKEQRNGHEPQNKLNDTVKSSKTTSRDSKDLVIEISPELAKILHMTNSGVFGAI